MMYQAAERDIVLDLRIATEVLDCDVWQDDAGNWCERVYGPLSDGYCSSVYRLRAYSASIEDALNLREEIFSRTKHPLKASITNPRAICDEALALNGAARYRPSKELLEQIEQSRWEEAGRWRIPLCDVVHGPYGKKRAAHIYIIIAIDSFLGEGVLYVGQTSGGVRKRLRQHISQKSAIGKRIEAGLLNRDELFVEVVSIRCFGYNSLNAAEQYFIEKEAPTYNVALTNKVPA